MSALRSARASLVFVLIAILFAAFFWAATGCGTTPRERIGNEEVWFTGAVDTLTALRRANHINASDYHNIILPAMRVADASLEKVHAVAATQPSADVDQLLAADAAWKQAKVELLKYLLAPPATRPATEPVIPPWSPYGVQ